MSAQCKTGRDSKRRRGLGKKTIALRAHVLDVLATFDGSMSSRQVFYQLVSRGAVVNNEKACDVVQRLLVAMRRDGSVPYSRIVDRTRGKHHRSGWDGAEDIMAGVAEQYRRDLWAQQDVHVHVCCEKQALEGVFGEIVDEYGAPLWTIRGFNSESFVYEWAEEIKALNREGRRVVVAFFGDHDPSGLCLEADCQRRLLSMGAQFTWAREGLLWEDFERFALVNVDTKKRDPRTRKYLETFGNRAAELDALPPDELRTRIRAAIERNIDVDAWARLRDTEKHERHALRLVTANWDAALEGARGAA
jgi:hypothetical protein